MKQIHRLEISWTISRGRDTCGYNICRLDDSISGKRYRTLGGGYDMIGTVVADWFEDQYQDKLQALRTDAEMIDCDYSVPGYVKHKDQFYGLTYTPKGAARSSVWASVPRKPRPSGPSSCALCAPGVSAGSDW